LADPANKRLLTAATPLCIASNTKTFVAATVLRLWEQRRIDLDVAIGPLLTPALDALLRADGYDTARITVRHLLSHGGGLYDHGGDPRFIAAVLAHAGHVWTREALVRLSMSYADPQSAPGTEFRYSDGYILIGDIVERVTGIDLAAAVRREPKLDRLGLRDGWWEVMEHRPRDAAYRARQYLGQADATDVHASRTSTGAAGW
jgi:D-alanyl-D-alanine carboxypeptidase